MNYTNLGSKVCLRPVLENNYNVSLNECKQRCDDNDLCKGFTYQRQLNKCMLFETIDGTSGRNVDGNLYTLNNCTKHETQDAYGDVDLKIKEEYSAKNIEKKYTLLYKKISNQN